MRLWNKQMLHYKVKHPLVPMNLKLSIRSPMWDFIPILALVKAFLLLGLKKDLNAL